MFNGKLIEYVWFSDIKKEHCFLYNPRNFSAFKLKNIKKRNKGGSNSRLIQSFSGYYTPCVGIWFHELSAS